jgi:hypothetical protein
LAATCSRRIASSSKARSGSISSMRSPLPIDAFVSPSVTYTPNAVLGDHRAFADRVGAELLERARWPPCCAAALEHLGLLEDLREPSSRSISNSWSSESSDRKSFSFTMYGPYRPLFAWISLPSTGSCPSERGSCRSFSASSIVIRSRLMVLNRLDIFGLSSPGGRSSGSPHCTYGP